MSFRRAILLMILASAMLAAGLAAVAGTALWTADALVNRVQGANGRLETLHDLDGATGRYGRQVVDQLLFGYDRSGALQTARNDMQRVLAALTRATREELNTLAGSAELQSELIEVEQVRRMTDLFNAIDAAATRAFSLIEQGEKQAADDMASRRVDFPLTNEMQPLIDGAIADERAEIADKTAELTGWREELAIWGGVLALAILGAIIGLALAANRIHRESLDAAVAGERDRRTGAEGRLRAIDSDRGQFLADVGHQLRTPLTVLRGEADVALRNGSPEVLAPSMERVRAQAAELAVLLDDLIDAARQAAESQPLEVAPIGLGDLIVVAAEEGRVLAEPREVAILAESPAGGPVINADFRQLKQAVMIGIDNAVKHSPPGGTIRVFAVSEGTAAAIRITDEGTGIADEDLPHLFERFYRGRDEGALLNTGFGIGLAIAKGIVERHDGTISLRNGETGGALFEILLPLGRTG